MTTGIDAVCVELAQHYLDTAAQDASYEHIQALAKAIQELCQAAKQAQRDIPVPNLNEVRD